MILRSRGWIIQLTALGIGADLAALDERYLFEGTKLLLMLATAVPVGIAAAVPLVAVAWVLGRVVPSIRPALAR